MRFLLEFGKRRIKVAFNSFDVAVGDGKTIAFLELWGFTTSEVKSWKLSRGSYGPYSYVRWSVCRDNEMSGWEISGPLIKIRPANAK